MGFPSSPPPRLSAVPPPPSRATVVEELSRIEQSPAFGGSARQMRMLRFLVDEVLEGRGGELRAPLVATRVFDRPEGFDSSEDSIVRVEMSKLRRALHRHYASTGPASVRVVLPHGSFVPTFVGGAPAGAPIPPSSERRVVDAEGPVLAVLPFAAQTAVSSAAIPASGPGQLPAVGGGAPGARGRALAHGLTDRLGALFTRAPGVRLLSRATTPEEAQAQGARYVLEGTVRVIPGALRITAKLHDTARGLLVWGDTYDRVGADDRLFAVEDEIAREIALQLVGFPFGAVHRLEARERGERPAFGAYDVALRFPRWLATFDPDLGAELQCACERILEDDPDAPLILAPFSVFHSLSGWTAGACPDSRRWAASLARRALAVGHAFAGSHHALAFVLLDAGDGPGALAQAETGLDLGEDPSTSGLLLALAGHWERGTAILRDRTRRMTRCPPAWHHALCLDAYRRGDYAAALIEAMAITSPHLAWDPLDRALCLARLGRLDEARAAGRELAALLPAISRDSGAVVARVTADEALRGELLEGLRLSGFVCESPTRRG